jgi:hypothetical protein
MEFSYCLLELCSVSWFDPFNSNPKVEEEGEDTVVPLCHKGEDLNLILERLCKK